jgi:hypothetical protein
MPGTKVEASAAEATPANSRDSKVPRKAQSAKVTAGRAAKAPAVIAKPSISGKASPAKQSGPKGQAKPATSGSASKPAVASKPEKATKAAAAAVAEGKGRQKMVRDSFTMPRGDYELIAQLKQRSLAGQRVAKKSELLRAGLHALTALSDTQLLGRLDALAPIKTGRPKKG